MREVKLIVAHLVPGFTVSYVGKCFACVSWQHEAAAMEGIVSGRSTDFVDAIFFDFCASVLSLAYVAASGLSLIVYHSFICYFRSSNTSCIKGLTAL